MVVFIFIFYFWIISLNSNLTNYSKYGLPFPLVTVSGGSSSLTYTIQAMYDLLYADSNIPTDKIVQFTAQFNGGPHTGICYLYSNKRYGWILDGYFRYTQFIMVYNNEASYAGLGFSPSIPSINYLSSSDDMNDISDGRYYISGSSIPVNYPADSTVPNNAVIEQATMGTSGRLLQTWTSYSSLSMYYRFYSGGTWTSWYKISATELT